MIELEKVIKRVNRWNAARYEQEYNHELSMSLLLEELTEWFEAESDVDKLDALCDEIYVALGVLWKLQVSPEANQQAAEEATEDLTALFATQTIMPGYLMASILASCKYDSNYPIVYTMHMLINCCFAEMGAMGLTPEDMVKALTMVCDANDTKAVNKTPSHIKANTTKGLDFISPEPALQALLDKVTIL